MMIRVSPRPYTRPAPPALKKTAPEGWTWKGDHWEYKSVPELQVRQAKIPGGPTLWRTYFEGKPVKALDYAYPANIAMEMAYEYFDSMIQL